MYQGIIATEKNNLTFPVLGDFGNKFARQFGIMFEARQGARVFEECVQG